MTCARRVILVITYMFITCIYCTYVNLESWKNQDEMDWK